MAITLLKAIAAIGLQTTSFLQSFFLFPFNTIRQALDRFRQPALPALPYSTSGSASVSSSAPKETRDNKNDNDAADGGRHNSDMRPVSSSATASELQVQKLPVASMAPALPRTVDTPAEKENRLPEKDSPSNVDSEFSSLTPFQLGYTSNTTTTATPPTLKDATNIAATGTTSENEAASQPAQNGTTTIEEVTRAPAIPLTHAVSQTSRPKEAGSVTGTSTTAIQLDGETMQIRPKPADETPEQAAERAVHSRFMREALDMARLALRTNETPVGCVLVYKDRVIARGMNATNVTRNGTRHAELMAISALLSYSPASDLEPATTPSGARARTPLGDRTNEAEAAEETSTWGDVDPKDGHLFPYGQKLHPSPRVDKSVISECTLYVTVEPCVMCASLLRQLKIKKVYFGAVNDKFGGTGGVFRIHKNSPYSMASAPPSPAPQNGKGLARPLLERRPATTDATEEHSPTETSSTGGLGTIPFEPSNLPGDGGNIERGYEAEGGWGRDEAVTLLRQFYVQENNRAPVPRKKEGRAARLAAMMERDGHAGGPMAGSSVATNSQPNSGANTPAIQEPAEEDVAVVAPAAISAA